MSRPVVLDRQGDRAMRKAIPISLVSGLLALVILLSPQSALTVNGQWGVVFAIDAPWRLEPIPGRTGYSYGSIPIVIMFRQAINEMGREHGGVMRKLTGAGADIWVGKLT